MVCRHTANAGDTLDSIAQPFSTSVQALTQANHIRESDLIKGQILNMPDDKPLKQPDVLSDEPGTHGGVSLEQL